MTDLSSNMTTLLALHQSLKGLSNWGNTQKRLYSFKTDKPDRSFKQCNAGKVSAETPIAA